MSAPFVPVLYGEPLDRPDDLDGRDVALRVAETLRGLGYEALAVEVGPDLAAVARIASRGPLRVFNLVDSIRGDDAAAPAAIEALDRLGVPYTGAGAEALRATTDKLLTHAALAVRGLPAPRWWPAGEGAPAGTAVIVKSVTAHASYGMDSGSVVDGEDAEAEVARREARFGGRFFAEEFVQGREFNLALMEAPGGVRVLPASEIRFDDLPPGRPRIVDYEAKWDPASFAYHHTPRRFGLEAREPALAAELARLARAAWDAFGLAGYARVDFRVGERGPAILEVNANPCLDPDAGFAATAAEAGLSWPDLLLALLGLPPR